MQYCFMSHGCDAPVLLDDTTNFIGEKTDSANNNSLTGFDVVDTTKSQVENVCPVVGPSWPLLLGRRDSTTANLSVANSDLPSPALNLSGLISAFSNKGFTAQELVVLSGSHKIGEAKCRVIRQRIYHDANIDPSYATSLKSNCPSNGGDDNLAPLDVTTPTYFDNAYYTTLLSKKGLLHSDQLLFNGGSTDFQVGAYSSDSASFLTDFANAMVKMGNLSPLTGTSGQIRENCRKVN
ncbi:hypothetical protein ACB092_09G101600 [Castanea dentata]